MLWSAAEMAQAILRMPSLCHGCTHTRSGWILLVYHSLRHTSKGLWGSSSLDYRVGEASLTWRSRRCRRGSLFRTLLYCWGWKSVSPRTTRWGSPPSRIFCPPAGGTNRSAYSWIRGSAALWKNQSSAQRTSTRRLGCKEKCEHRVRPYLERSRARATSPATSLWASCPHLAISSCLWTQIGILWLHPRPPSMLCSTCSGRPVLKVHSW